MRELKFRAWATKRKIMMHNQDEYEDCTYLAIAFDGELQECQYTQYYPHVGPVYGEYGEKEGRFKIMQFTGLKDKNGKEIYEGDVVNLVMQDEINDQVINAIFTVKYSGIGFRLVNDDSEFNHLYGFPVDKMKVIGNIFETPGFMEKEE